MKCISYNFMKCISHNFRIFHFCLCFSRLGWG